METTFKVTIQTLSTSGMTESQLHDLLDQALARMVQFNFAIVGIHSTLENPNIVGTVTRRYFG